MEMSKGTKLDCLQKNTIKILEITLTPVNKYSAMCALIVLTNKYMWKI